MKRDFDCRSSTMDGRRTDNRPSFCRACQREGLVQACFDVQGYLRFLCLMFLNPRGFHAWC